MHAKRCEFAKAALAQADASSRRVACAGRRYSSSRQSRRDRSPRPLIATRGSPRSAIRWSRPSGGTSPSAACSSVSTSRPGQALMTVVPLNSLWVDANFKEAQLRNLRIGQPAEVRSDLYGGSFIYHGRVIGMAAGHRRVVRAACLRRTRPATGSRSCSACRCGFESTTGSCHPRRCASACRPR